MRANIWLTGVVASVLAITGEVGLSALAASEPAGSAAESQEGRRPHRPILNFIQRHFHRAWELRSKLNLTEDQKTRIRESFADRKAEIIDTFKEVSEKRRALREAVLAEMPSEESIRAAAENLGKAVADAAVKVSQMTQEVRKNLTSEQLEQIRKFKEKQQAEFDRLLDKALSE